MKGYLEYLFEYALKADKVVELGVGEGNSTLALLKAVAQNKRKLISIDKGNAPVAHKRIKESGLEENWIFIQEDDLQITMNNIGLTAIDLLYIDTSHEYEHTKKELEKFLPLVADKGIVLLHDISPTGWDVQKAIDDFLSFHSDWDYTILFSGKEDPGGCGLGLLKRKKEGELNG